MCSDKAYSFVHLHFNANPLSLASSHPDAHFLHTHLPDFSLDFLRDEAIFHKENKLFQAKKKNVVACVSPMPLSHDRKFRRDAEVKKCLTSHKILGP